MRKTQTVVVLPKLALALARPMSDVPNSEGFRLLGILPNGLALPLVVRRECNGCHYLENQDSVLYRTTSEFTGWVPDTAAR